MFNTLNETYSFVTECKMEKLFQEVGFIRKCILLEAEPLVCDLYANQVSCPY